MAYRFFAMYSPRHMPSVQAMPTVLLAARRGQPGFVLCAGFMALCAVATLSSLLPGRGKR